MCGAKGQRISVSRSNCPRLSPGPFSAPTLDVAAFTSSIIEARQKELAARKEE
jgi:hypothetical protein